MTIVGGLYKTPSRYGNQVGMATFLCDNEECQRLSLGLAMLNGKDFLRSDGEMREKFAQLPLEWVPDEIRRPDFPDVPNQIAKTASEAHACLSIKAFRGAVALARAVLEATAKDKGCTTGPLIAKIDALAAAEHLREDTRQLAHEIREGGNEIAHGDLADEPMPAEDAQAIVSLMDEVLLEVYQGPAKVARLRASRLERKDRNSGA
ncbi:DUF4145 domain-containing protein [Streptomyces sp. NPDC002506]|uniref:DUF4145 domain-containing protein n=1 Tax=Streptomyces sp. NPDC002506 TaxID=3154536 RepID=UPI00331D460F